MWMKGGKGGRRREEGGGASTTLKRRKTNNGRCRRALGVKVGEQLVKEGGARGPPPPSYITLLFLPSLFPSHHASLSLNEAELSPCLSHLSLLLTVAPRGTKHTPDRLPWKCIHSLSRSLSLFLSLQR